MTLEELQQCSVCGPALKLLHNVHQSYVMGQLEECFGWEKCTSSKGPEEPNERV
jgi:hypothetical protein